jgi:DNA-binding NarL/FixJ family response regulator
VRERFAAGDASAGSAETVPLRRERVAAARVLPGEDVALVQVRAEVSMAGPEPRLDALGLTPAQQRVAHGLAAGLANRAIALRLGLSEHTARRHTEQIFTKLGVRSRAAAALRLMGSG